MCISSMSSTARMKQQFLIDPRVIAGDAGGQGAAEGAPFLAQRGVLGDPQGTGEEFMAPVIGYRLADELSQGKGCCTGRIQEGVGGMLGAPAAQVLDG